MKKLFQFIFTLLLVNNVTSQTCVIDVTPIDTTVCPGDSVLITAYAGLVSSNQMFNFNGGALPPGWSVSGGSTFSEPCEQSLDGTPYYWASTSTASNPDITTAGFDVSCGGIITFDMDYATQAAGSPCEGPDEMDEGVSLQYSIDGGATWITIVYYCPDGNTYPANTWVGTTIIGVNAGQATQFTSWDTYSVIIPPAALSTNTMFRWVQESPTSGTAYDNWGVDNIIINASGPPCSDAIVNWGGITDTLDWFLTDTTSFWMVPFEDTVYMAMVYDSLGNYMCSSDSLFVFLSPDDLAYDLIDTALIYCPTDSVQVGITNIQNGTQPLSYSWSNGYTTQQAWLQGTGLATDTVTYYLDIVDGCGYTRFDSVTVVVDIPTITFDLIDSVTLFCPTDSILVSVTNEQGGTGPYTYDWSNGYASAASYLQGSGLPEDTLMYYVDVYDNCGYMASDSVVVVITNELTFDLPDTVFTYCPYDSAFAEVTNIIGGTAPYTYTWSNGDTLAGSYVHADSLQQDEIWYYVNVTGSCGYFHDDSVLLVVNQTLQIDSLIMNPASSCVADGSVQAYVSGVISAGTPYEHWGDQTNWDSLATTGLDTFGFYNNEDNWMDIGSGWYYFTISDDECIAQDSIFVEQLNAPQAVATASPTSGCNSINALIENNSTDATDYYWDYGNGETLSTTNQDAVDQYYTSDSYIMLIAYENGQCPDTAIIAINIIQCGCTDEIALNYDPIAEQDDGSCIYPTPEVVAPNIFTPNGDGDNDMYWFDLTNVATIEYTITNRWGNVMISETIDLTTGIPQINGWDGRTKIGQDAEEGTYFYIYKATGIVGDITEGHGFLHLVRN